MAGATVKLLTLNLWGEQAPLDARLALVIEGCRRLGADVVTLQEVREVPSAVPNTARTLAEALGFECCFAGATPWGGGEEGIAILSRFPVERSDHRALPHAVETERRVVLGASLASPAGPLGVFTTHLNYRLADGAKREDQVEAVDEFIAAWHGTVPFETPRLLAGDFNAVPWSDEIRFLRGLHTHRNRRTYWQDAWECLHPDERGYTWARRNPYTQRLGWLEPDRRLDYVFVSPLWKDGRGVVHDCRVVLDEPGADGVWPSDHFGLYAEVQLTAL